MLKRPPVRRPAESIVALIDVVFFLLVFALLVGRMDATAPFAVHPPVTAVGTDLPAGGITVTVAQDGTLALEGRVLTPEDMLEELEARLSDGAPQRLRFNADAKATTRDVVGLIGELWRAGAREIVLIVTPEET